MAQKRSYNRAIERLRSKELEKRLGAIRALEGIARESESTIGQSWRSLIAYVRQHAGRFQEKRSQEEEASNEERASGNGPTLAPYIQAIMYVLQWRTHYYGHGEPEPLDLQGTDLNGANLQRANLIGARFQVADFSNANLQDTNLSTEDLA